MPSMKDIRKKISSTKNMQQITKAFKMVSAAKLRRAQNAIVNARPYAYKIHSVISRIAASGEYTHPLMVQAEDPQKILLVVLTSDRGLCGPFNSNVIKYADRWWKEHKAKYQTIDFIFLGRKGNDYFKRRGVTAVETITNLVNDIRYDKAAVLADKIMNDFTKGSYDEVIIVYNEFKSAISQKVIAEKLLPIQPLKTEETVNAAAEDIKESSDALVGANYIFEPGPEIILSQLVPKHFAIQIYRAMLESIASEHGARMSAMDSATRNAGKLIKKFTLAYNKLRQAAITKELMEIVSGAEALK